MGNIPWRFESSRVHNHLNLKLKKKVIIIGSGFSSLSASCYLAKAGFDVSIYEKNFDFGGRARQFKEKGFTFDMGPSWYWMPDVFERFFNDFGKKSSDLYEIKKLNPAYRVIFDNESHFKIGDSIDEIVNSFEKIEKGSGEKLIKFLNESKDNYDLAVTNMLYKMPGKSIFELINTKTISKINLFVTNIKSQINKIFKNRKLRSVLQFPVLFLGAKPSETPAFYNFMNYADFGLGTWQPKNGFYDVVQSMIKIAKENGVKFYNNSPVDKIIVKNNTISGVKVKKSLIECDILISGADYSHTEQLLEKKYRQYSEKYWSNRTWAPSSLLFYIGLDKKINDLDHHNLFFDTDFDRHADEIYTNPKWPESPLFYLNITSKTFKHTAPKNCENLFILVPIATNLEDTDEIREKYFDLVISRIEKTINENIKDHLIYKKSYCVKDFKSDYNSFGGNAYGLANTLTQTAFLRPKLKSKKVKKLYFSGQLTVPGPGVPPAIVSGKLVSDLIINDEVNF